MSQRRLGPERGVPARPMSGGGPVPDARRLRQPSGLFPTGPPRPAYREPHPVRTTAVAVGVIVGTVWMVLAALLTHSIRGYVWVTVSAGIVAWAVSLALVRFGDRGVAAGVALASGFGITAAMVLVVIRWIGGVWLLW